MRFTVLFLFVFVVLGCASLPNADSWSDKKAVKNYSSIQVYRLFNTTWKTTDWKISLQSPPNALTLTYFDPLDMNGIQFKEQEFPAIYSHLQKFQEWIGQIKEKNLQVKEKTIGTVKGDFTFSGGHFIGGTSSLSSQYVHTVETSFVLASRDNQYYLVIRLPGVAGSVDPANHYEPQSYWLTPEQITAFMTLFSKESHETYKSFMRGGTESSAKLPELPKAVPTIRDDADQLK